ncbi:MAG: N-acetylmuramoyl-L-alanine amidase [Rhodospirillales bacterium]|nr:N-acetylmuramoyl-L-alanine amidase [Rhodospirillales bacterium]
MKRVASPSPSFDARPAGVRPELLVLHYTDTNALADTLAILLDPARKVSAHYVVDEDGTVHALVDEAARAWHAGVSCWRGHRDVNARSIGIEIQNPGHRCGYRAFPDAQIDAVIALCREIAARHAIAPRDIVGHSDVAPSRKCDPGELFPWARLAKEGVGLFPSGVAPRRRVVRDFGPGDSDEAVLTAQNGLVRVGYDCPVTGTLDEATQAVLVAFQRRFRPARFDGRLDGETQARLTALLAQIFP